MSLLERFRKGSEFDSVGRFTLDEGRAKKKMANYQLVRPADYLLLACQAAVAAACRSIEVRLERRDITFQATGVDLQLERLARLEEYLFDQSRPALPYYLLGVAQNAIAPFCAEEPAVKLDGSDLIFEVSLEVALPEVVPHLSRHLRFMPAEIRLNGEPLSTTPLREGVELTLTGDRQSHLLLVRHGVVVGEKQLLEPLSFSAVVEENALRLDASFANVVEDEVYLGVLKRVRSRANETLAQLAADHRPGEPLAERLLKQLSVEPPEPAWSALSRCPLFPLADRGEYADLETLRQEVAAGRKVLHSPRRLRLMMDLPVVLTEWPPIMTCLRELFQEHELELAEARYQRFVLTVKNKELWEKSPRPTELPPARYLMRRKLEGRDWEAEIGFLEGPGESHVDLLYQGKLLTTDPLEEAPPGATAVVNFHNVEIHETWSRPVGREYRSALKEIRSRLDSLFNEIDLSDPDRLYPELVDYLLELMERRTELPLAARSAPLFPTVTGEKLSLDALLGRRRVGLGEAANLSSRIPPELLPDTILLDLPRLTPVLKQHLPSLEECGPLQKRLQELDLAMADPIRPVLVEPVSVKEALSGPGLEGEIGLVFSEEGGPVELSLLFRGAVFARTKIEGTRAVGGRAIVSCDDLSPNRDWSAFELDGAYLKLCSDLTERLRGLEEAALTRDDVPPRTRRRLLHAFPHRADEVADRPLIDSAVPWRYYSLNQLEQEIKQHGALVRGPDGSSLPDRAVLPEKPADPLQETLIRKIFGTVRWMDAERLASRRQSEARFKSLPVVAEIAVKQPAEYRFPLQAARGEVVLGSSPELTGQVDCFLDGRYICRKENILPPGCAAAVESPELLVSENYLDADIPEQLLEEMLRSCERGMLAAACGENGTLRKLALTFARDVSTSPEFRESFEALPLFELQDGGRCSLSQLPASGAIEYVGKGFPRLLGEGTVLRLDDTEFVLLQARCGGRLFSVEYKLRQLEEDRRYLAGLPTTLPDLHQFRGRYEDERLAAELAVNLEGETVLLGHDEEGQPLGYIALRTLPVWGLVRGCIKGKREDGVPMAGLVSASKRRLKGWINSLYADWAESLSHRALTSQERAHGVAILEQLKSQLGSKKEHHQAGAARKLWALPLFPRVDGTWISGEALTDGLEATGEPVVLSDTRWRAPGSVVLCTLESPEYRVLRAVLGERSLQWYQAPPLLDPAEVGRNIHRLVSWGISPLRAASGKVAALASDAADSVFDVAEHATLRVKSLFPEGEPGEKRPKKRSTSPEALFRSEIRTEARTFLGRNRYNGSNAFRKTEFGSWVLGPPVYFSGTPATCRFNRVHPAIRWLINTDSKTDKRARRIGQILLLIHWVALVNEQCEFMDDEHERLFLIELAERATQTFG